MTDLSSPAPRWPKGARVRVFNPGPGDCGVVREDTDEGARRVPVLWDDHTTGHPWADLLRIIEEAPVHA
jgi:hypothetical protein